MMPQQMPCEITRAVADWTASVKGPTSIDIFVTRELRVHNVARKYKMDSQEENYEDITNYTFCFLACCLCGAVQEGGEGSWSSSPGQDHDPRLTHVDRTGSPVVSKEIRR